MKYVHNIDMRVFCKEDDNEDLILKKIKELFPIDFEKEKIILKRKTNYGFEDKKIVVFTITVNKQRHTKVVLKNLIDKLSMEQKEMLLKQLNSRLDKSLHFYLRLDKDKLLNNEYWITDSGTCFHFKMVIAVYPHDMDVAKEIVKEILKL